MTAALEGVEAINKLLDRYERRFTKERADIIVAASKKAFVPDMKQRALRSPGKAGPIISKAVRARKGRNGAVLVGPKRTLALGRKVAAQAAVAARPGIDKKSWNGMPIAQFFVAGSKAHEIGDRKAGGTRTYYSEARRLREANFKRTRGGNFDRTSKSRDRVLLTMPAWYRGAYWGPVHHRGIKANPFVDESAQAMRSIFVDELRRLMFSKENA